MDWKLQNFVKVPFISKIYRFKIIPFEIPEAFLGGGAEGGMTS